MRSPHDPGIPQAVILGRVDVSSFGGQQVLPMFYGWLGLHALVVLVGSVRVLMAENAASAFIVSRCICHDLLGNEVTNHVAIEPQTTSIPELTAELLAQGVRSLSFAVAAWEQLVIMALEQPWPERLKIGLHHVRDRKRKGEVKRFPVFDLLAWDGDGQLSLASSLLPLQVAIQTQGRKIVDPHGRAVGATQPLAPGWLHGQPAETHRPRFTA